jgi:hypothetical protein
LILCEAFWPDFPTILSVPPAQKTKTKSIKSILLKKNVSMCEVFWPDFTTIDPLIDWGSVTEKTKKQKPNPFIIYSLSFIV